MAGDDANQFGEKSAKSSNEVKKGDLARIWGKIPSLDVIEHKSLVVLKVIVILFFIIYIFKIGFWIFDKEDGIVIQPFEIVGISDEKLNGKPLADLLRADLQHIKNINDLKQQEPPFYPRREVSSDPIITEAQARSMLSPEPYVEFSSLPLAFGSEYLDFRLSQVGNIGVGQSSLSVGQILLSLRELSGNDFNTITCSLQRYGNTISIVAILEYRQSPEKEIVTWVVEQEYSGNDTYVDGQITALIDDLAYQIAHRLGKRLVQSDADYPQTWKAFRYLISAKEAYFSYVATSNVHDLDKARELAQLACKCEPGYMKPFDVLSNIGFSYISTEESIELDKANQIFQNISYHKPFESAYGLGLVYSLVYRYQDSINKFEEAIVLNPSDYAAWGNKGASLANLNRYDEAVDAYDRAIELNQKKAWIWSNKASALYSLARYNESLQASKNAIELDPKSSLAWTNKAGALYNLGRYNESIQACEMAIDLEPELSSAWNIKGAALMSIERYNESLRAFEKAIVLSPLYSPAWSNKGATLFRMGKYNESLQALERTINLDLNSASAWYNKGIALLNLGRYNESLQASEEAIELDPKSSSAWRNKGAALFNLGRYNESLTASEKALDFDPNSSLALAIKKAALSQLA